MKLLATALGLAFLATVSLEAQEADSIGEITVQTVQLAEDVPPVVSGRVIDARTGAPLPGVQFWLDGTKVGDLADESGFVNLPDAKAGNWTLRLRHVGYHEESFALQLSRSTAVHVMAVLRMKPLELSD